ncbi:conserved hypothetical protein [Ricinus communis]|uniref:Uncharacterized protein n=1 Tax=Ricinus communis TaxID=3988 RepID=B9T5U6_RICCO|nr:conserved hypothetical protein [Ricinus communis]
MAKYYNNSYLDYFSYLSMPLHLFLFIVILILTLSFSWYINYESKFEELINQLPERDSLHRAGGSPWGVALLLVFLLFMISYQSSFHERWFPLVNR